MNRTLPWIVGASLLATAGCAGTATEPPAGPPTLAIGPDTMLLADEALAEPITARDGRGRIIPSPSITWQSSSPAVASVDGSGHVTAHALGTATLTATMDSIEVHATITVVPQFTQLATGELHACGVTGRAEVYCWGTSFRGELGPLSGLQDCGARFGPGIWCSALPVHSFNVRASAIVAGEMFTCALDATGHASCWGSNYYGEAGTGSVATTLPPTPVTGGYQFTQLVAGRRHACGLTASHDAYCWGWDYSGALGTGEVSPDRCLGDPCRRTPQLVTGGHQWTQLSATDRATCGVTTSNELYCWGLDIGGSDGLYCQMPDNLAGCTRTPLLISSSVGHRATGIGNVHRCEQALDGSLDCWGANYWGMLGNGTLNPSSAPTPVSGSTPYTSFVAGRDDTCALTSDGGAQCWGRGAEGQIGNGSLQDALVPTGVNGGHRFTSLTSSGSADFFCGLDDQGRAYCWGQGDYGQLGDGTFLTHSEPALVRIVPVSASSASMVMSAR